MQLSLQPFTTAGIALVGASAIALSPLAPPPVTTSATTAVSTAAVQLSAAVDPLTRWGQVASSTATNIEGIAGHWLNNPLPLERQIAANLQTYANDVITGLTNTLPYVQTWATSVMPQALETAFAQIQAGEPDVAASTISVAIGSVIFAAMPLSSLLGIPRYMVDHFGVAVKEVLSVQTMLTVITALNGALSRSINAIGVGARAALDASNAGDPLAALTSIANIPAEITDAILNSNSGLLNYRKSASGTVNGGIITQLLLKTPERIVAAIKLPTAPTALTAAPMVETPPAESASIAEPVAIGQTTVDSSELANPESTPAELDATAEANASSTDTTDLSATDKLEASATKTPSAQRVKTSLRNAADKVDERIKKLSSGIEKSVNKVTDNLAKAGKKKQTAGSTSSASASDKASTDSDD